MLIVQGDFAVVGTAADGLEALKLLKADLQVDIVLADLNMPGMDGIELTKNLTSQYSNLKVMILIMHDKSAYLKRALAAGASGYLLKNGNMDELYDAIREVNAGGMVISTEVTD
jgi:DNA-binding NarL/FixJ family response regulator